MIFLLPDLSGNLTILHSYQNEQPGMVGKVFSGLLYPDDRYTFNSIFIKIISVFTILWTYISKKLVCSSGYLVLSYVYGKNDHEYIVTRLFVEVLLEISQTVKKLAHWVD